jgi:ketosteroid isomerase-like protein
MMPKSLPHGHRQEENHMPADPSAREVFQRAVDLMRADDIDAWLDLCHDDIVMEFPFAPSPAPRRIDGKESLGTHLKGRAARRLSAPKVENIVIHECSDPATVIAEMTIRGEGSPDRPAIAVIQVRDGLMRSYRDYYDPMDLMSSTKGSGTAADVFRETSRRRQAGDIGAYLDLCSDDVRFEMPFAENHAARLIEGKAALEAHMRDRSGVSPAPRVVAQETYLTDHTGTVISEYTLLDAQGATHTAVSVVVVRDGLITSWRDYLKPRPPNVPPPVVRPAAGLGKPSPAVPDAGTRGA